MQVLLLARPIVGRGVEDDCSDFQRYYGKVEKGGGGCRKAKLDKARATNKNDLKRILIPASGKPVRAPLPPMDLDRIMRGARL